MATQTAKALAKVNLRRPDVMATVQAQVVAHYRSDIVERIRAGLCSIKQASALSRRGYKDADKMSFADASKALDRLYGSRT